MAYSVDSRANNPANQLRDALDAVERLIITPSAQTAEDILIQLDNIEANLEELVVSGMDVRSEESRWQSLLSRISSRPEPLAAAARSAGGMSTLRAKHPPADSFWWHLDQMVRQKRTRSIRRMMVSLVTIVGGLLLIYWAINFFFPPDPATIARINATSEIERAVIEGDNAAAMAVVEEAKTTLPDEPEILLWEVVLAEQMGDEERAQSVLAQVQELLADNPEGLWITLGNQRLLAADLEGAKAAANEIVAINPDNGQAYFLLGGAAEAEGDILAAIDYFGKTADLTEEDNPQLSVIAKVRLGQLLQNPNLGLDNAAQEQAEQQPAPDAARTPTAIPTAGQ